MGHINDTVNVQNAENIQTVYNIHFHTLKDFLTYMYV